MNTIIALDKKIKEFEEMLSQSGEKTKLQSQIMIIDECEKALSNDKEMINFNFDDSIELIRLYGVDVNDLPKKINDIKNVLSIRERLNLSDDMIPLAQN